MALAQTSAQQETAPKHVTVLGSTGSVGSNTIDLIRRNPDQFIVEALTANTNVEALAEQAKEFNAGMAVVADPDKYQELKDALAGTDIDVAAGPDALVEAASRPADWVMASIVGTAGLPPTLAAVRRGAVIGLANKECLVSAGDFMLREIEAHGATMLPVDSEHNAIFQVLDFDHPETINRIILTASGGPFRTTPIAELEDVTPEQAVAHPNWDMGAKISVDSASMFNKGLELIEAYHLFPVDVDQIEIVVHPQSVIHSMVGYVDGSVLAQLGTPDMRTPIAYSLAWPTRMDAAVEQLDFEKIATLNFEAPDPVKFPALRLAREALQAGNGAATVMNAANEIAVAAFLGRKIGFLDIARIVEGVIDAAPKAPLNSLDDVFSSDIAAREIAKELIAR
jgi:1-deoxy-D-xylulose-5-phosphate reductoisomerase